MNKPTTKTAAKTAAKSETAAKVEYVTAEEAQEFHAAGAAVNEAANAIEQAQAAYHGARAVFQHVGQRLARKYGLGPEDAINPDGTIVRAAPDAKVPA